MFRDTPNRPQDLQPQEDFYSQPTSNCERLKKEPSRAQKRPPRRPRTLLERWQLERAKAMLRGGAYAQHVAEEIGVPPSTFRRWLSDKQSAWREGLTRRERNQLRILQQFAQVVDHPLRELLEGGKDWTQHARWLETVDRKEWGRK